LLVCAAGGPFAAYRSTIDELAVTYPNLTVRWAECGHMIPLEKPDLLATVILDFLAAHLARASGPS
jgi:pimeloyl-ACP methyl ester carboxylesterase